MLYLILSIVAVIAFILFRDRLIKKVPQPELINSRPSSDQLPVIVKENDKLVVAKGIYLEDIRSVLAGFCNLYNKEKYQALPRMTQISEKEFAFTFPYDIDFEIYCYFINYLYYPMEVKWTVDVTGWTTGIASDKRIPEKAVGKKMMLFIPANDTEGDNVYMTTEDNIGYKLGFAWGHEKKLLPTLAKEFRPALYSFVEFEEKEFEDFR
ncbi:MAG: hypothetical protein QM764_19840 [Chitinophagaceae bacterium]